MACSLLTSVTAVDPNGKQIAITNENNFSLKKGSKLNYRVTTASNGVAKSDKFNLFVIKGNDRYAEDLVKWANNLPDSTKNDSKKLEDAINNKIDESRLVDTVYSQQLSTNSNGVYQGSYTIPSYMDNKNFFFVFSYGYSKDSERGTKSKAKEGAIAYFTRAALLGLAPVGGAAGWALLGTEIGAEVAYEYVKALRYAPAGKSKHGCSFPNNQVIIKQYSFTPAPEIEIQPPVETQNDVDIFANLEIPKPILVFGGGAIIFLLIERLIK